MKLKIRKGLILGLLLVTVLLTGCSGDSTVTELTEGVEGPSQVIFDEESDQFTATGPTGATYEWHVDTSLGEFTSPTSNKTKFTASETALYAETIDLSVFINDTEKKLENIEVLGSKSETEYAKGTFHSIATATDLKRKGYVAVGTVGNLELEDYKKPYMVKSDNRGITIDKKTFERDGRFYNVQDFVRSGLGDYYYLIGYGAINSDISQDFVLEVNNKMEVKKEYDSNEITTGNVYLRSGIISKNVFSSDHLIAVGNRELDNGNYAPYIINIDTNDESSVDRHVLDSSYGYDFSNPYYNLESIIETDNGYIAVGFTNDSKVSREGAEGIILELNSDFNVTEVNTSITDRLFKIKKVENVDGVDYVLVGDGGYIGEIDDSGSSLTIESDAVGTATYRDVLVDGSNYIVIGKEGSNGVVAKLTAGSVSSGTSFKENYGSYLYSGDIATDGDYLLAGQSNNTSYVVKIDPTDGTVVNRVK